jgi:TPR repeat protein
MQRIAEQGDVRAQHWMGLMLHNRGYYDEAIRWYARALDNGDAKSASRIAFFYELGIGRPKDPLEALRWHRKGAALGDFTSRIRYAAALRSGTVLPRNEREAFGWYAKAASQRYYGHEGYAYLPVAEMLEEGIAVPRDLRRAYAFAKAAELTVDDSDTQSQGKARNLKLKLAARLEPDEMRDAEHLFQALRPDLAQRPANRTGVAFLIVVAALVWIVRSFRRNCR